MENAKGGTDTSCQKRVRFDVPCDDAKESKLTPVQVRADKDRFQRRIAQVKPILDEVLHKQMRDNIWRERFDEVKRTARSNRKQ